MSAIGTLRARTEECHALVDAAFCAFDLGDEDSYREFLTAHARVLPTVENILSRDPALPKIRLRTPALASDMAQLQQPMPELLKLTGPIAGAAAWGILYVVEGSRLGGGILSARVGANLPTTYLAARHEPGEWRALGQAIETQSARHGHDWIAAAVAGAEACFDLFRQACDAYRLDRIGQCSP